MINNKVVVKDGMTAHSKVAGQRVCICMYEPIRPGGGGEPFYENKRLRQCPGGDKGQRRGQAYPGAFKDGMVGRTV